MRKSWAKQAVPVGCWFCCQQGYKQIARGESGGAGQIPAWKPQGGTVDVLPFAAFVFHKGV